MNTLSSIPINRTRYCLICNKEFTPRLYQIKNGQGKYCSILCRNKAVLPSLLTKEAKLKSKETYKKNLADGKIIHPSGKNHPRWKGGEKATIAQGIKDGKRKESVKKYSKNNLDKVREWSTTRHNRKTGRLPKGTVKNKIISQNYLCVYCKLDIKEKYHVDHIVPLAKGGKHEPSNIQILCPSCNVKKWTKSHEEFLLESLLYVTAVTWNLTKEQRCLNKNELMHGKRHTELQ